MKVLLFLLMAGPALLSQGINPFELQQRMVQTGGSVDSTNIQPGAGFVSTDEQDSLVASKNPFELRNFQQPSVQSDDSKQQVPAGRPSVARINPLGVLFSAISLILLAVGLLLNRSRFYSMFRSVINSNYLKTLMRTTNISSDLQLFLLYAMALINLALFGYLTLATGQLDGIPSFRLGYFSILGIFTAAYLVRHLVLWFLESIFPLGNNAVTFGYSIAYHNIAAGAVLLPFVLGLQFGPPGGFRWLVLGGLVCFGLIYLLRQFKGGLLAIGIKGFNPMYFFLYLCAIELAPVLIGLKVFFNSL